MKIHVLDAVWCIISGEAAGEIWHWSLLGVEGLMHLLIEALPIFIGMPSCHRIGGQEERVWSVLIWRISDYYMIIKMFM